MAERADSVEEADIEILDNEIFAVSRVEFARKGHVKEIDSASGFFFEQNSQFYFITNRHVVVDESEWFFPDEIRLKLHIDKEDLTKNRVFPVPLYEGDNPKWFVHPEMGKNIDVVALPVEVPEPFYVKPFKKDRDLIDTRDYVSIGDDLIVIGYPLGIHDSTHNMPIIRNASLASVYPLPYGGQYYFLIDSILHAGTSGSPVLLKLNGIIRKRNGRTLFSRGGPFKRLLIGIHSGQMEDTNLNVVWYAKLILDIIEGKKRDFIK